MTKTIDTDEQSERLLKGIGKPLGRWERATAETTPQLPNAWHASRSYELQKAKPLKGLFDCFKEEGGEIDSEGKVVLTKMPFSLVTLKRLDFALAQTLYNTSYLNGTTKENTGLIKDGFRGDTEVAPVPVGERKMSAGMIDIGLSSLTSLAFGLPDGQKPTTAQKKEIMAALEAMGAKGVEMVRSDGVKVNTRLYTIVGNVSHEGRGREAAALQIFLHPIFIDLMKGTAAHPQDIMKRMAASTSGKVTEEKLTLLSLLGAQEKSKTYERYKSTLLQELGMYEEYKKQGKKYGEKKLSGIFQTMRDVKILLPNAPNGGSNPEEVTGANGELKYIFHLNPNYIEKNKRWEPAKGKK